MNHDLLISCVLLCSQEVITQISGMEEGIMEGKYVMAMDMLYLTLMIRPCMLLLLLLQQLMEPTRCTAISNK